MDANFTEFKIVFGSIFFITILLYINIKSRLDKYVTLKNIRPSLKKSLVTPDMKSEPIWMLLKENQLCVVMITPVRMAEKHNWVTIFWPRRLTPLPLFGHKSHPMFGGFVSASRPKGHEISYVHNDGPGDGSGWDPFTIHSLDL